MIILACATRLCRTVALISAIGMAGMLASTGARAQPLEPSPHVPAAQDRDLARAVQLNRQGGALLNENRFADAKPVIEQALAAALRSNAQPNREAMVAFHNLAAVYRQNREFSRAIQFHEDAAKIAARLSLPDQWQIKIGHGLTFFRAGRPIDALKLYDDVLQSQRSVQNRDELAIALTLNNIARVHEAERETEKAIAAFVESLAIRSAAWGKEDRRLVPALEALAGLHLARSDWRAAMPVMGRLHTIFTRDLGSAHPKTIEVLRALTGTAYTQEDSHSVIRYGQMLIEAYTVSGVANDERVGIAFSYLRHAYSTLGRTREALHAATLSRLHLEKARDENDPDVIRALGSEATLMGTFGRADDAQRLYEITLQRAMRRWGEIHPYVALIHYNIGNNLAKEGRLREARLYLDAALRIRGLLLPKDHPDIGQTLLSIAVLDREERRFNEAIGLLNKAIGIFTDSFGARHRRVLEVRLQLVHVQRANGDWFTALSDAAEILANLSSNEPEDRELRKATLTLLGILSLDSHEFSRAGQYFARARELIDLDNVNISDVHILGSLARAQESFGHIDQAVEVIREALSHIDRFPQSLLLKSQLKRQLGELLQKDGQHEHAEPLLIEQLQESERIYGFDHVALVDPLRSLASLYIVRNQFENSFPLLERAQRLLERARGLAGGEAPARNLMDLAWNSLKLGWQVEGLRFAREASRLSTERLARVQQHGNEIAIRVERKVATEAHFALLAFISPPANEMTSDVALIDEAFRAAQQIGAADAARALAGMSLRMAAGSDEIAQLARERQDLTRQIFDLEAHIAHRMAGRADERRQQEEDAQWASLESLKGAARALDERLRQEFPRFAELTGAAPVPLAGIQALLSEDEALAFWIPAPADSYAFLIRKNDAVLRRFPRNDQAIARDVTILRDALDPKNRQIGQMPPFDVAVAHGLYRDLLGFAEDRLAGIHRLIVVGAGPLQSLPPAVLVTSAKAFPRLGKLEDYREVPWLIRRFAISVLPAVSSIRDLRTLPPVVSPRSSFAGFGNPDFRNASHLSMQDSAPETQPGSLFRGARADPKAMAALAPLPDTEQELLLQAKSLGAQPSSVVLGKEATVSRILSTDLSRTRILSFATHGLIAGELPLLAEPALAFTPPAQPIETDDGLLRASQIAQMKLDADWVILSACNTAAADGRPGAEGLSGLAKAFFYAGARSLLVSYWTVDSSATVRLTTSAIAAQAAYENRSKAEAIRISALHMLDGQDPSIPPEWSHPFYWAPFVVVGEK